MSSSAIHNFVTAVTSRRFSKQSITVAELGDKKVFFQLEVDRAVGDKLVIGTWSQKSYLTT